MENAVVALICIAIILVGVLIMVQGGLYSVDLLSTSWKQMEKRTGEIARTDITALSATSDGTNVEITLKNEGETKLYYFDHWDVVIQYYQANGTYWIKWLPYTETNPPGDDEWTVEGIYLDAKSDPEVYDPGIFNPGEEIVIWMKVNPLVGLNTSNLVTVATANGVRASINFSR